MDGGERENTRERKRARGIRVVKCDSQLHPDPYQSALQWSLHTPLLSPSTLQQHLDPISASAQESASARGPCWALREQEGGSSFPLKNIPLKWTAGQWCEPSAKSIVGMFPRKREHHVDIGSVRPVPLCFLNESHLTELLDHSFSCRLHTTSGRLLICWGSDIAAAIKSRLAALVKRLTKKHLSSQRKEEQQMALLLMKLKTFRIFHRLPFKNWWLAVITRRWKVSKMLPSE